MCCGAIIFFAPYIDSLFLMPGAVILSFSHWQWLLFHQR